LLTSLGLLLGLCLVLALLLELLDLLLFLLLLEGLGFFSSLCFLGSVLLIFLSSGTLLSLEASGFLLSCLQLGLLSLEGGESRVELLLLTTSCRFGCCSDGLSDGRRRGVSDGLGLGCSGYGTACLLLGCGLFGGRVVSSCTSLAWCNAAHLFLLSLLLTLLLQLFLLLLGQDTATGIHFVVVVAVLLGLGLLLLLATFATLSFLSGLGVKVLVVHGAFFGCLGGEVDGRGGGSICVGGGILTKLGFPVVVLLLALLALLVLSALEGSHQTASGAG